MRILIPDQQTPRADVETRAAGDGVHVDVFHATDMDSIPPDIWRLCDAVIGWHLMNIDAERLAMMERCRVVVRVGVGYDNVDVAAAAARNIAVFNVPDYGVTEVADHAIAMMLALRRHLIGFWDGLRADPVGRWDWSRTGPVHRLRGDVFGVVGLGRIGLAAARRAAGFDMEVIFYDPYLPDGAELGAGYRRAMSLAQLLGESDVVSLHTPLTDETRNMINPRSIGWMKPNATLINTARGPVVDPLAVLDALRGGRLGGAGLDVLPCEPPAADDPLARAWAAREPALEGRLIVTPHSAFYSAEGFEYMRVKAIETALAYLREGNLRNCVNGPLAGPSAGSPPTSPAG